MGTGRSDFITAVMLICLPASLIQGEVRGKELREPTGPLGRIPAQFQQCQVTLEPDKDQAEWWVDEELWAYAEVAKPNESNEIRLSRRPR